MSKGTLQRKNWLAIMLEWTEVNIGVDNNLEEISFWRALEKDKPEFYLGHCFGKHGGCQKEYEGKRMTGELMGGNL
jgi:hypothetical protein